MSESREEVVVKTETHVLSDVPNMSEEELLAWIATKQSQEDDGTSE